jgi:hypothetical protein
VFMYPIVDRRADFHPSWSNNSCACMAGPATVWVHHSPGTEAEDAVTAVGEVLLAWLSRVHRMRRVYMHIWQLC